MKKQELHQIANGIYEVVIGIPEVHTPTAHRSVQMRKEALMALPDARPGRAVEILRALSFRISQRGVLLRLPMDPSENIYGFGLQFFGINSAGKRRLIKVNSDPVADTGESHAPVPFYISSSGYALFVDTYRTATFQMGTVAKKGASRSMRIENEAHTEFSESALYALKKSAQEREILIEIPRCNGVRCIAIEGSILECVQRYNLFSGGGVCPPEWGLYPWYRLYGGCDQKEALRMAKEFRADGMPIKVIGIEPGWHSHSYSCTYRWSDLFPAPQEMIDQMQEMGYALNLWEHAFVYPAAEFYEELLPYAGDYEVWNGLVPDFAGKEAREIFKAYHQKHFIDRGISGLKLDECDNSDYNPSDWSFPECSQFPSGMDGEQMHQALGILYQDTIRQAYAERGKETYSEVRSSGALASPQPFVLYSDLYDHRKFITALVNSGFSGLLWCPEVRDCVNGDDLLRRLETVIFSHQALINAWRIPMPPWKQTDIDLSLAKIQMEDAPYYTAACRKLLEVRISLIPYLKKAFEEYQNSGKPPIRALVMDYPEDPNVADIGDEYLFGDEMIVCPLTYEEGTRKEVYLPKGRFYGFFDKRFYEGGRSLTVDVPYDEIPVFVKESSGI
ncbi:MAG: glycoside hydrolase [Lachnospiraceae bacterium]|nr:glycoside hydrolase [Lachnospiraceae bacterium]